MTQSLFCQVRENLKKKPLTIGIQGQLGSHHQVHDFSNDHVKFKFQDGLFYRDGLLYVPDGPMEFQVFKARYDALVASHFGFNKTMELMS
jgi:hypothetical protein